MRFSSILVGFCLLSPLWGQNGATLLSQTNDYSFSNDIWGYTAPDGREYAILGTLTGTAFYNVSNPSLPVRVGFIPGPVSLWRDMKTLGPYCYIVTEGGGGVQIVDLNQPDSPTLVQTFGTSLWNHAHNIAIDLGASMAYIVGADPSPGMAVLDLANPTQPVMVASYNTFEVHDAFVQHGKAHLAELYDGNYRIVSVQSLPSFPSLGSTPTPGGVTHNVWVNDADTIAVTTDENRGGGLAIYDIQNPAAMQMLATWSNNNATVHNAIIKGNRIYASWYSFGFACLDITNPSSPQQIAAFDASPTTGTGYNGTWGVYPFAQSGLVYLSDQDGGLFILRIEPQALNLSGATQLQAGSMSSVQLDNAPSLAPWYLLYSFSNAGSRMFGTDFEVGPGWGLFTTGTTDAAGSATFSFSVPTGASGRSVYLEAATAQGGVQNSNMLRLSVL